MAARHHLLDLVVLTLICLGSRLRQVLLALHLGKRLRPLPHLEGGLRHGTALRLPSLRLLGTSVYLLLLCLCLQAAGHQNRGFRGLGLQAIGLELSAPAECRVRTGHQCLIWETDTTPWFVGPESHRRRSTGQVVNSLGQSAPWRPINHLPRLPIEGRNRGVPCWSRI